MNFLQKNNETYKNVKIKKDGDGDEVITADYKNTLLYLSRGHSVPYLHVIASMMKLPNDTKVQLRVMEIINELNSTLNCCRLYSSNGHVNVGVFTHLTSSENLDEFIGLSMSSIDYAFDRFSVFMENKSLEG